MKYKDKEFVEFFRRVLDFPRRGLLNAQDPNFMEVINDTVAVAAGAKIYLPPETFLTLRRPVTTRAPQPKYLSARTQAYDAPRISRGVLLTQGDATRTVSWSDYATQYRIRSESNYPDAADDIKEASSRTGSP